MLKYCLSDRKSNRYRDSQETGRLVQDLGDDTAKQPVLASVNKSIFAKSRRGAPVTELTGVVCTL